MNVRKAKEGLTLLRDYAERRAAVEEDARVWALYRVLWQRLSEIVSLMEGVPA